MHEPHALLELRLLMLLGSAQRAFEIVEDREKLGDQPLICQRDVFGPLTRRPLLVVLEVGGESQQPVVFRFRLLLLDLLFLLKRLVRHEVGASSSTTSYSPSSTTSSPPASSALPGAASPLPPADACACAVAWA